MDILCDMGDFLRKQRPKETVKLKYFYARFEEEWMVVEKHGGKVKECYASLVIGGDLRRPVCLDSSRLSFVFRDWMLLSSWCREGASLMQFHDRLRGCVCEEMGDCEGQSNITASVVFLNSFSLRYSICQGAILWESMFWTLIRQNNQGKRTGFLKMKFSWRVLHQ